MAIFLKEKKQKKGNPMKDLELTTIPSTQFNTEVILPESPEENHINSNSRNADSKKSTMVQRKRRIRLPKTVSTVVSKAREKTRMERDVRTNDEPKENMKHIIEKLKLKLRESRLSDEIQGLVRKVDGKRFKNSSLSRIMIKGAKLVQKGDVKRGEKEDLQEEDTHGEMELCKKRILMGEKCRPLNSSGALRYDNDGIFVPDDVSSK